MFERDIYGEIEKIRARLMPLGRGRKSVKYSSEK